MEKEYKIFLDMDGVITNMQKSLSKISDKPIRELGSVVWEDESFWENLEWMPDGRELFEKVKAYGNYTLLSSPGRMTNDIVISGKEKWIRKNLGENITYIFEVDKFKYAEPCHILIDDSIAKVAPWLGAGGMGILHHTTEETLQKIEDYTRIRI